MTGVPFLNAAITPYGMSLTSQRVQITIKIKALQKLSEEDAMRTVKRISHLMLFFIAVLFTSVLASEGEGTTVSCYTANHSDYEYVGELEVFNLAEATSTCNNAYYNCQGACIGCYINSESIEVCIDKNGNQFVKE